jgi:hypothetical protein
MTCAKGIPLMEPVFDDEGYLVMDVFPDDDVGGDFLRGHLLTPPPPLTIQEWQDAVESAVSTPLDSTIAAEARSDGVDPADAAYDVGLGDGFGGEWTPSDPNGYGWDDVADQHGDGSPGAAHWDG